MKVAVFDQMSPAVEWNELARKICKSNEENKLTNQEVLDEIDASDDDEYDDELPSEDNLEGTSNEDAEMIDADSKKEKLSKKPLPPSKQPKEKSTAKPKVTTSAPPAIVDSNNENDESAADEDYNYEDEEEDEEDESITGDDKEDRKTILVDGISVIKNVDDAIFGKVHHRPLRQMIFNINLQVATMTRPTRRVTTS